MLPYAVDDTLRTLARAARGDLTARGAELRALLRARRLDVRRLEVAAELGDGASATVVDASAVEWPVAARRWVQSAERWGWPVVVRAVVGAVREALPEPGGDPLAGARLDDAVARLDAVESWCDSPTAARAQAASRLAGPEPVWTGWNVLAAPVYAGHLPALVALESQREGVSVRCRSLVGITLRTLLETGADDATLCAAMRATLLRWALTPRG